MQLEEAHIIEITKLMEYVDSTEDPLIQIVRMQQTPTQQRCRQLEASRESYRKEQDK
jgi:hypothetical protein